MHQSWRLGTSQSGTRRPCLLLPWLVSFPNGVYDGGKDCREKSEGRIPKSALSLSGREDRSLVLLWHFRATDAGSAVHPFNEPSFGESRRDSVSKPRVARNELPWERRASEIQPQRGCAPHRATEVH